MAPARRSSLQLLLVTMVAVLLALSAAAAQRVRQISDFLVYDLGSYAGDDVEADFRKTA